MSRAFIGTSGFMYKHWAKGVFYPPEVPQKAWLEYYVRHFDTVEINLTFYRLPKAELFGSWYKRTPGEFFFALKGSRYITHLKRLLNCRDALKIYFERAGFLKEKMKVILWQLPPRYGKNVQRLETFINDLQPYAWVRHAFEFRDESWFSEDVYQLLRMRNMAVCQADWGNLGHYRVETADFVYMRRHGSFRGACYSDPALRQDAGLIRTHLDNGKDVYLYFNNDASGYAVKNALTVKSCLG